MKVVLLISALLCSVLLGWAQDTEELVICDFEDPEVDGPKWGMGDSGDVVKSIETRTPTEVNKMLKVVFESGRWPGITTVPPKDWSPYEALRMEVWTAGAATLNIRIDDPNSTGYETRYGKTFKLDPGLNLCQIEVSDIGRKLDVTQIKALILFTSDPPAGLTFYIDNIVLGKLQSQIIPFIPYEERKDLQPTLQVATPHLPFARNLAGGALKVFTMSNVGYGREIPELMQRMDLDVSHMTWDRTYGQNTWGFGDFYGKRGHAFDYVLMQKYIASTMQGPEKFEMMAVTTPQGWDRWPQGAREALMKRVKKDGEGLMLVFPFPGGGENAEWPEDLKELSALINSSTDYANTSTGYFRAGKGWNNREDWVINGEHPITADLPLDALPTQNIQVHAYEAAPDAQVLIQTASGLPVLAVKQVGNGRVAAFAWRTNGSLTPNISDGPAIMVERPYRYWEPLYSLIGRTMLWCGKRDAVRGGESSALDMAAVGSPGAAADRAFDVAVWKNDEGRITDWQLSFTPPAASTIKTITLTVPEIVNRGDEITVEFAAPEGMDLAAEDSPYTVQIQLGEQYNGEWRTLEQGDQEDLFAIETDTGTVYKKTFPTSRLRQLMGIVRIAVSKDSALAADGMAELIVSPLYVEGQSRWDDYEVLMWPVGGLPFLQPLEDTMMKSFGSTGVMETRWQGKEKRMRWARAGLRLMVHDFARKQLQISHSRFANLASEYNKTKNKDLLIRKPSYADPDFLAAEKSRVPELVRMLKPYNPTNYITCDEPSLSSYSKDFDFDFHPANITGFREAMEAKFETIANFNAALNEEAVSFDALEPPLTPDARTDNRWGIWNEWRAYNDQVMADGYKMYKELVQSIDPNGTISISGTQLATPFDGFDWYRLSPHFGTMQGYGYAHQDNKRMSFNPDMLNAVPAGYGRSGKAVDYQIWSKVCDHGCGHVLFWWIAFRNYDLSYCQSARDYMRLFAELKQGIGRQYIQSRRKMSPVGILYSMNSMRAAYTETKESRTYSGPEGKVTDALIAAGYDPIFIADQQVAAGELEQKGIKVLVMPMTLSLGYGDKTGGLAVKAGIEAFIASGGTVFYTHAPKYDEFLQPREADGEFLNSMVPWDSVVENLASYIDEAGVAPWAKLNRPDGTPVPKATLFVHELQGDVDAHMITVLRPPAGTKEIVGGDGVVYSVPDDSGGKEIEAVVLDVSGLGNVTCYDIRSGYEMPQFEPGKLQFHMPAGDGYPIALLPYAVTAIQPIVAVSNDNLQISWTIQAEGADQLAPHVVRITILDTDGNEIPALSRNSTTNADGTGMEIIPLALEDKGKADTVRVKDVLTGKSASIQLKRKTGH